MDQKVTNERFHQLSAMVERKVSNDRSQQLSAAMEQKAIIGSLRKQAHGPSVSCFQELHPSRESHKLVKSNESGGSRMP